ncbi:pyrroline-5-carboxylate reductase [Bacillus sp. FJAT-49736]|uniref:pyrroline-5-carboxylate reductase n=1 Tax=Bacillus sp. FJAT-49736 TaxID=2833582 RepID=UPI001BCA43B2|nr:pyrroline-5-carboxylate reductase [Bacillus sp. FJAT-49736]MBS4173384.1 pyrroline-5-carboxylate reductase [Bacillus sp. FJAT-49736]
MKITFIGAGSMAEAIIGGLVKNNVVEKHHIYVTNRSEESRLQYMRNQYGVQTTYNLHNLFHQTDIVVLAVKPKDAMEVLQKISSYLQQDTLLISVIAGVSLSSMENILNLEVPIIRAMPNTSAAIGKSATAIAKNKVVKEHHLNYAFTLFSSIGLTVMVDEEKLDAVTGLSGSGPAYIYYIVEAMENSAMEIGLETDMAKKLIVQTLLGAAEMLSQSSEKAEKLRFAVTSPGGTTEAGIRMLDRHKVKDAFVDCIKEATKQSKRLSKQHSKD